MAGKYEQLAYIIEQIKQHEKSVITNKDCVDFHVIVRELLNIEPQNDLTIFRNVNISKPTETPIEMLQEGDRIWHNSLGEKKVLSIDKEGVHTSCGYYYNKEFLTYFTTIPPHPSPKQGHNRAELLEVVKAIAVDYVDAAQCVVFAQSLLNEVNKVCQQSQPKQQ